MMHLSKFRADKCHVIGMMRHTEYGICVQYAISERKLKTIVLALDTGWV
jgi:hypothetical protein